VRDGAPVLHPTSWAVAAGQRWVLLGPNGAGKSTILRLASTYELPTRGTVSVLGHRVGRTPVADLRRRIGVTASHLERLVDHRMTVRTAVATGFAARLVDWHLDLDGPMWAAVDEAVARLGLAGRSHHRLEVLSEGERRRTALARALVRRPELLLLDEPTAGLDVGGREQLLLALSDLAADPAVRAIAFVTHHVEEVPPGFTHAALVVAGTIAVAGPIAEVLTDAHLGRAFGVPLRITRDGDRWAARHGGLVPRPRMC
jgi:iron complex transport system ATP-binding protein